MGRSAAATSVVLAIALPALAPAAVAAPTGIADDFEIYAPGGFPAPLWLDGGAFDPRPPAATLPSATVEPTTDAAGNPTQALRIRDEVALVAGAYQIVPVSTRYALTVDMRIDRLSNNATLLTADGPSMGFLEAKRNFYDAPQVSLFVSSFTGAWGLLMIEDEGSLLAGIDFGVPLTLGQWTRATLDLDTSTGAWAVRLVDVASMALLLDTSGMFPGWTGANGRYDVVGLFDAEFVPPVTEGNLTWFDNVNVTATPVPATLSLLGLGVASVATARRRRSLPAPHTKALAQ